jgi:hypothetical protein
MVMKSITDGYQATNTGGRLVLMWQLGRLLDRAMGIS